MLLSPSKVSTTTSSGTVGTFAWRIDTARTLHIEAGNLGDSTGLSPWNSNVSHINKISLDGKVVASTLSKGLFRGMVNVTSFEKISNFNTSKITDMSNIFNGASALTGLDLSFFNTSNVTNAGNMFSEDTLLSTITLGQKFVGTPAMAFSPPPSTAPSLYVGETWDAKANIQEVKDQFGHAVNVNQVTVTGTVDTIKPGTYTITYTHDGKT